MDEKRRKIRNKCTQLLLKSKKISEGYESSWSTHCRMFGDLLEPAFADDESSRLELAFKYEDHVLVERFIKGRELTVGVMGGKAMPVIEIIPKAGWYDYKNKYQAGLTEEICPAPISEKDTDRVQRLAERVSAALMVDVYCRADFLMDNASGEIYCLEANTLPGMTPTSLIPQMGREEGLDFGEVCEKIIKLSMEKY